jgi:hypothetical protein
VFVEDAMHIIRDYEARLVLEGGSHLSSVRPTPCLMQSKNRLESTLMMWSQKVI